jgi:hypothetical protein
VLAHLIRDLQGICKATTQPVKFEVNSPKTDLGLSSSRQKYDSSKMRHCCRVFPFPSALFHHEAMPDLTTADQEIELLTWKENLQPNELYFHIVVSPFWLL